MNSKLINGVTEFLTTAAELKELKNFVKDTKGGVTTSFAQAVEIVEANVHWHSLYKDELFQWLRKSLNS
uniref:Uncharacterized protein n=2 Tax=Latimeria chalumnae TaxID=7897 RepID=M3XJ61_LATCH